MDDIVKLCKKVLDRLSKMDYEREGGSSNEQLIFPKKNSGEDRISEQELRQLFIDEFKETYKETHNKLYYSIETPTQGKYKFGKTYDNIKVDENGQSALLDMCVFEKSDDNKKYKRILNIEFKHQNAAEKNIAKDVLKLMHEKEHGVFILLLKNTDRGTLYNSNVKAKGLLNKLKEALEHYSKKNDDSEEKSIWIVIISLEQKTMIYQEIKQNDNLGAIFSFDDKFGDITMIEGNGWKRIQKNN